MNRDIDYEDFDLEVDFEPAVCIRCNEDCAEDVDCTTCGLKFWISSCLYGEGKKPWPTQCPRCEKGLPPLYEY